MLQLTATHVPSVASCLSCLVELRQVHCNTLQHTATHCNTCAKCGKLPVTFGRVEAGTLQHTATCCNTCAECGKLPVMFGRVEAGALQHTATHTVPHCNTLQHTAAHCNTLQHTTTHYNTLQHTTTQSNTKQHTALHCNTLQYTSTYCNTLQHTATHCNTLQHTATREPNAANRLSRSVQLSLYSWAQTTGWQKCIEFLISCKSLFRQRATNYKALSREMTCKNKAPTSLCHPVSRVGLYSQKSSVISGSFAGKKSNLRHLMKIRLLCLFATLYQESVYRAFFAKELCN